MSIIQVSGLGFHYGRNRVFENFELMLDQPGIYGLFGRNGSGKSTLLKILAGLLFPHAGTVSVLGHRPATRSPDFLEQIYIVPEEFHLPDITLAALQVTHAPFYPRFSASDFQRYISTFDIPQDQSFASMSLGQKKKSVIAFALATHTPVLLMDEPTNGLDILSRSQFKAIMGGSEHKQRIVLISTHQAHDLETLMSHVLFADAGQLALSASMHTLQHALLMGVQEKPENRSIYQEPLGQQWAYVSHNQQFETSAVHLELLYKALSLNKAGVLKAISAYQSATRRNQ